MSKEIFTLEARNNTLLEVMEDFFNLDNEAIFNLIDDLYKKLIMILKQKNINYSDLKTCLIPSIKKNEILLVFDRNKISDFRYGNVIFSQVLSCFEKDSSHSILTGDYIGHKTQQKFLYKCLIENIDNNDKLDYQYSNQFYLVYLNNISSSGIDKFKKVLEKFDAYVGYVNLTFKSSLKTYVSTILCNSFIKYKNFILMSHEEDRNNDENINVLEYEFEKYNFKIRSISTEYFDLFLSYKIEREVFEEFEKDLLFSLNSISISVIDIKNCLIKIDDNKLEYLKEKKIKQFKKANCSLDKENLILLIKSKLMSNYIYNLRIDEYGTLIFNIILEIENELKEFQKMCVSFEYKANENILRLITMY